MKHYQHLCHKCKTHCVPTDSCNALLRTNTEYGMYNFLAENLHLTMNDLEVKTS